MSDTSRAARSSSVPPPAPPLPPSRAGAWKRLVAPLGFGHNAPLPGLAPQANQAQRGRLENSRLNNYKPLPSQTAAHRTGIPIAALDSNKSKTHAVLAGQEILKTIRIEDRNVTEDVNLRSAVISYNSVQKSGRRQFLPAETDVKWSHGTYGHLVATAAENGPIVLYDVNKTAQLSSFSDHRGQVHRLAFDPHLGRYLLSASQDGTVKMWDNRMDNRAAVVIKCFRTFPGRVGAVRDVRWSPTDSYVFATASDTGVIQKWDLHNYELPVLKINAHGGECSAIDWHPDGKHVLSAGLDRLVRVYDFQSTNKRQKPSFVLRCPQAIKHARWRPACWSAEYAESGNWQSTQLVTSYKDDPRLHVWDLRRRHLPFRELDRYNSPATDVLWASKDLLWTVGEEGMFTQTDVSFATQVHKELPPCSLSWTSDGGYTALVEDRTYRRESNSDDPAIGFLSIPQEKLSNGDNVIQSRSLTDEEMSFDGSLSNSLRRRSAKSRSARSTKSQASTPPVVDGCLPVRPLDKTLLEHTDLFKNRQAGVVCSVPGAVPNPDATKYLAEHYAPASLEQDRQAHPELILRNLEAAFWSNADACDWVSLHRTAQSWRILASIIIPELQQWADRSRSRRLHEAKGATSARSNIVLKQEVSHGARSHLAARSNQQTRAERPQARRNRLTAATKDSHNTSNMTTPLAHPLPDSPYSDKTGNRFRNIDDSDEGMVPLPPSVITSHTTAGAAAKALRDSTSLKSPTPPSSPENPRDRLYSPGEINNKHSTHRSASTASTGSAKKVLPRPIQQPSHTQRQEDRRAVLRDYRAQARPVLTFDQPANGEYRTGSDSLRRDSAGSFQMFSASTDSFGKRKLFPDSFTSPDSQNKRSSSPHHWDPVDDSDDFGSSFLHPDDSPEEKSNGRSPRKVASWDSGRSRSASPIPKRQPSAQLLQPDHARGDTSTSVMSTSPDDPFQFETDLPMSRADRQTFEATRDSATLSGRKSSLTETNGVQVDDLSSKNYLYRDFQFDDDPAHQPVQPFAWSSIPLVTQSIAFDLSSGSASAQFSAHLLMLVEPFLFRTTLPIHSRFKPEAGDEMVSKFMDVRPRRRLVESINQNYAQYLRRVKCYVPLAELRKAASASGSTLSPAAPAEVGGQTSGDAYEVNIVCVECHAPMHNQRFVCDRCASPRAVCPVCSSVHRQGRPEGETAHPSGGGWLDIWTSCQACGHGAHVQCMQEWLAHVCSEGTCPTVGCGCDCSPGLVREKRLQRQMREEEDTTLIRGTTGPALSQKDAKKASPSAAVQKARLVLREGERTTQSGDERGAFGSRRSSRSGFAPGQSQRKSVRLITPAEERPDN